MIKRIIATILIIIGASLLSGCGPAQAPDQPQRAASKTTPPATPAPPTVPESDPTPTPEPGDISPPVSAPQEPEPQFNPGIMLVILSGRYLSDGSETREFEHSATTRAAPRIYVSGSTLTEYDATGDIVTETELEAEPTAALVTDAGIYYCRQYSAQESFALGAQAKIHTEIYKDDQILSFFAFNQYSCAGMTEADGNVWIIDDTGGYHPVEAAPDSVTHVQPGRFYMSDLDLISDTINFNGTSSDFELNYIITARAWINHDGTEYSENGYTWTTGAGLSESATAMHDFNISPYPITPELPHGENPVLITAGAYKDLLLWIECNSGWLISYDPDTDTRSQSWRLYDGDGTHEAGVLYRDLLKPLISGGKLYYSIESAVMAIDIETGVSAVFYGGSGYVEIW